MQLIKNNCLQAIDEALTPKSAKLLSVLCFYRIKFLSRKWTKSEGLIEDNMNLAQSLWEQFILTDINEARSLIESWMAYSVDGIELNYLLKVYTLDTIFK